MTGSIETKAISASNLKLKLKLTDAELGNYLSDGVKNDLQSKRTNIKAPKKYITLLHVKDVMKILNLGKKF